MRPIKGQRWNSFPRRKVPILMTFFSSKPMSLKPVLRRGIFRADNRILDRGYLSTSLVKISIFLFFFFLKKSSTKFSRRNSDERQMRVRKLSLKTIRLKRCSSWSFFSFFKMEEKLEKKLHPLERHSSKAIAQRKKTT